MKYSTLSAFEKHLEGAAPNHFSDVYMILAKEQFIRKQAIDYLIKLVLKDEKSVELCIQLFDTEKHGIEVILQDLDTLTFFAKKRIVIIQNADGFDKASSLKLEAYLASPNRSVCLLLVAPSLTRTTTFYKKAEKVGIVLDVAEEKPWEREKSLGEWLKKEAISLDKQISSQASQMLLKQLGTDQALLHNELKKLACYIGIRILIEERDVAAICTSINLDNAWQLGEALFRRDAANALRISKALLAEGTVLIAFLRQIRSQFQTEYQICSILTCGGGAADITQEFPYMKGTILERHIRHAQEYGMKRFKKGILAIDETELQAKNSAIDPEFLAEKLIIQLTL